MDSHGEQVRRAREAAVGSPSRRYFAYSTILDRAAFDEWRTQHEYERFDLPVGAVAEALEIDLVYDFPSRWWGGRVAGLTDRGGASVWGLLFEIPGVDWPIIQHKEGAITGMCVEREVRVRVADGAVETATAFTTHPQRARLEGPVSERFIEALIRGAQAAQLHSEASRGEVEALCRARSRALLFTGSGGTMRCSRERLPAFLLFVSITVAGCADIRPMMVDSAPRTPMDPKILADAATVRQNIIVARGRGAVICAPEDLAIAEANYDFARVELWNDNPARAREHILYASAAAARAIDSLSRCPASRGPWTRF
jgi:cation transport regulator ChaC